MRRKLRAAGFQKTSAEPERMRTFLGSQRTPCKKKTHAIVGRAMASDAEDPVGGSVGGSESPLGIQDEAGQLITEEEGMRTEGSSVLWGEFQGTQQNDGEDAGDWVSDDSWAAFTDSAESDSDHQDGLLTQCSGRWWCESSTTLCTREYSTNTSSVGHIFEHCFPPISHPHTEEDVTPLESLLQDLSLQEHRPTASRDTCDHTPTDGLWGATPDHTQDPDTLYKWEGSQIRSAYLSSLHIKPNDKIPPNRTRSSPAPKQRVQPHKMSTGLGRELKLMKVASVSVHVTGFSPSHHLQSLFQHWSQPSGKTRLKVAYDFNRSLLV